MKHHRRIQIQNHAASGLAAILRVFISLALAGILFPLADSARAMAQDSYRKAVMAEPALISYYSFEGDLRDATGAHHGASVAGAAVGFAPGVGGGKAVSLDGSGGISLGRVAAMEFASGNGTVEAWIRAAWQPGTRPENPAFFSVRDDQRGGSRYSIHIRQADRSILDVFSTGKGVAAFQPFDLTDDSFHHVAVVFSIGFVAVYLDGQLVQSHPAGLGPLGVSAQVGHYSSHADGKAWIGQIDELAVYGRPLSQETIQAHVILLGKLGPPLVSLPPPTRTDQAGNAASGFNRYRSPSGYGGVPLGGLGAGSVEIRPDGSLRKWEIFNNWGGELNTRIWNYAPPHDLLNVFAALKLAGRAFVLETGPPGGLPGLKAVDYRSRFPFADLTYTLPDSTPVDVTLEAFSSYIPFRAAESAIPAFALTYTLKNRSASPVEVTLALSQVNPLGQTCRVEQVNGRAVAVCDDGRSGLALMSLDAKPVHVLGGPDNAATLQSFWADFTRPGPLQEQSAAAGQRIAQAVTVPIAAGQSVRQRFVVGWYFPDHREGGLGPKVGHRYEQWTRSAAQSAGLLAARFDDLRSASGAWRDTLADASWPGWVSDWLVNCQANNIKSSWWVRDGRFITYESVHCPNMGPILLTDMGHWPLLDCFARLDLDLQRRFVKDQFANGRFPEQYDPDSITRPNSPATRDLVDIPSRFATIVYNRYRATGNREFLEACYEGTKRGIQYTHRTHDQDGDGLLDHLEGYSRHAWDLYDIGYCPAYTSYLWLAGQKAAMELAHIMGDAEFAGQLDKNIQKGLAALEAKLWNGQYYDLVVDRNGTRNPLCMSGQVGEGYTEMVELAPVIPQERMRSALRAIAQYNAAPTKYGLVIVADRQGRMFVPSDDRVQILTCRVIPPMIAMIAHGEVDTGMKLLERSYRMFTGVNPGGLWNPTDIARADGTFHPRGFGHYVMCGGVWAVMKALHGWDYNAPQQALRVGPVLGFDMCHGPWITPAAYGTLRQTVAGGRQNLVLETRAGTLALAQIRLRLRVPGAKRATVTLAGQELSCQTSAEKEFLQLTFDKPVALAAGRMLNVETIQ